MSDLVSRVLAAIEQAEEDARDASTWGDEWSVADHVAPPWGEDPPDDVILAAGKPIATMNTEYGGCLAASHVAHNDPAAVLRRCAADRKLLERGGPFCSCYEYGPPTNPNTGQSIPHHYDCSSYEAAALLAGVYGISVEEETTGE